MSLWSSTSFVKDLGQLIKLIGDFNVPIETDKLNDLLGRLKSMSCANVSVKDIVIKVSKAISKTKPQGVQRMTIYFSHTCECDNGINHSVEDPIKNFYFYFQINGYGVTGKEYVNCWRLDKDIKSAAPKYTHPYYHFQAGGDELQYKDSGDLLLLSAPRLPHPPMDLFLGLHFLLSNYLSTKDYPSVKSLFDSYEYECIIKRAQERVWVTYFNSFSPTNTHSDFTFKNVFPLFLH